MRYLTTIILLMVYTYTFSQHVINGSVKDSEESIIGATVYNENQARGTTTDLNGNFTLDAQLGDLIRINYLGYRPYQWEVTSAANYDIQLTKSSISLNEIVVTALGLERQTKDLGFAVQELKGKDIAEVKAVNFIDNLTSKIAGVSVNHGATGVGSTSKITIRGESSFTNNNPLFVVDGIPVNNATLLNVTNEAAAGFQEVDFGNGAMDINPDDIASISVLKGPSAAALYGTRAANGVIVITTKDGSESQGLGISFNTSYFADSPFALPKFQNLYGQGNAGQFAFVDGLGGGTNDNITYSYGPRLDQGLLIPQFDSPVTLPNGDVVRGGDVAVHGGTEIPGTPFVSNPDNLKDFYETGSTRINNLSISNNFGKGKYRLSFTDLRSDSYIPGVNLDRQTVSGKFTFNPIEKLKITSSLNYIFTSSDNRPASGYGSENINYSLVAWLGRQSNLESLQDYWQPGLENVQQYSFNYTFFDNPYLILLENRNAFNRNRIFGNIAASYEINDKLSVQFRSGLDNLEEARSFRRAFSSNRFKNGAYAENDVNFRESNTDILITYKNKSGAMSYELSAGGNRLDQKGGTLQTQAISLAQPGIFSLANAASPLEVFQYNYQKRINSVYGFLKLGYKDFLYLDITGRNDWSSALASPDNADNVSFFYPSVSSSFILSNVMNLPSAFSFFKLRASWAQVANDTDPYQTVGVFNPQTPVNGSPTFSDQNFIPNQGLLPEQSNAFEIGADIRLFDDRFGLDIAYYQTKNQNQILSLPIAASSGYNQQVTNGGTILSKGLELVVNADLFRSKDFRWSTILNFSTNTSRVQDLPSQADQITLAYSRVYDNPNQTVWFIVGEGDQIGNIWGTGYLKNENGDFVIAEDGKLIVDNTLKKLGNYNPDFVLGFTNQIRYKHFGLNFTFDWRHGGQIVSRTQALAGVGGQLAETGFRPEEGLVFPGVINIGTSADPVYVENTIAINPETYYRQFYDRNHEENNLYDASFLKLRELQLSYSLSKNDLNKSFFNSLESITFSIIGRNLFAISDIPHFDPEQIAVQGNTFINGVEDMSYPTARSIGAALNIKF